MADRQILATSGGFRADHRSQIKFGKLVHQALRLSGKERPRLCFVNTADGDATEWLSWCYQASSGEMVDPFHLQLFTMPNVDDIRSHLCSMDVIWVGGGSVANLLNLWRLHGVDEAMQEAWENGTVLAGVSAGSLCWHIGGTTDSFGPELRAVTNGLGFLPYGNGVHYDGEERRRPLMQKLVAEGVIPISHCTDNGVGLYYRGTELIEAVTEVEGKSAWTVEPDGKGGMVETAMATRLLEA